MATAVTTLAELVATRAVTTLEETLVHRAEPVDMAEAMAKTLVPLQEVSPLTTVSIKVTACSQFRTDIVTTRADYGQSAYGGAGGAGAGGYSNYGGKIQLLRHFRLDLTCDRPLGAQGGNFGSYQGQQSYGQQTGGFGGAPAGGAPASGYSAQGASGSAGSYPQSSFPGQQQGGNQQNTGANYGSTGY